MELNDLQLFLKEAGILDYCLNKDGAYIDFPFGLDYITVKVKNGSKSRIFAEMFVLDCDFKLTFSTDETMAEVLRTAYPQIVCRGWHCPPVQAKYKSTVTMDKLPKETLLQLIDLSYERAVSKLK
ncbi:MAG: MmcQ/YjbR family DNA-binding protein [Clostridia bacterium]|nr:MmcQ/YjbR family DNA-binding protein [Clostridia bacterium]